MDVNLDIHYDSAQANLYEAKYDEEISYKITKWESECKAYYIDGNLDPVLPNGEPNTNWDAAFRVQAKDLLETSNIYYSMSLNQNDIDSTIAQAYIDADTWLDGELSYPTYDYTGEYVPASGYWFDRWGIDEYYFGNVPPPHHLARRYKTKPLPYDPPVAKIDIYNERVNSTYLEEKYNIGAGWSLGFPSIEFEQYEIRNGLLNIDGYLHTGDGNIYKIWIEEDDGDIIDLGIEDYTLQDMNFNEDHTFSNGQALSNYVLIFKDGTKKYFDDNGKYIGVKERNNNTIKIQYDLNGYPQKIIDTLNREITFQYQTTADGREVIISAPDTSQVKLVLEPVAGYANDYVLTKIYDQVNRSFDFSYEIQQGYFNFEEKDVTSGTLNTYANLKTVTYPTLAQSEYSYEKNVGNLSQYGLFEYYRTQTSHHSSANKVLI